MLTDHTLDTLISLANKEEEILRKNLQNLNQTKADEIIISDKLMAKYHEYQHAFDSKKLTGLTLFDWKNYYTYIEFLTNNINEQHKVVDHIQKMIDEEQLKWNEMHKKQLMYGKLLQQKQVAELQATNKREQKDQDQWNSRQFFDKQQESA